MSVHAFSYEPSIYTRTHAYMYVHTPTQIPCCFTSYHRREAMFDCRTLREAFSVNVTHPPTINPFASEMPIPDPMHPGYTYSVNQFLTLANTNDTIDDDKDEGATGKGKKRKNGGAGGRGGGRGRNNNTTGGRIITMSGDAVTGNASSGRHSNNQQKKNKKQRR